jgi:hypothetical protein
MISVIEMALVLDDRSSGYQVRLTADGTHTEKLEHGLRYGFGLFQQHEVSGVRQVDHSHPLAYLLTQRISVGRHSGLIIESLNDQEGSGSCGPPLVQRYVPACPEMRNENRGPAFDRRENARIRGRRQPAHAQPRDAVASVHLDLTGIAKVGADRSRLGRDETARREHDDFADQRRAVDRQAPGDPVTECVTDEMYRTATQHFYGPGYIRRQIVKRGVFQRAAALSDPAHVDADRLEPAGSEGACQIAKVTDAAARIGEKYDWIA